MSDDKPSVGIWQDVIIWHVDENGNSHWGSPADRAKRIAEDRAPQEASSQSVERDRPRGRER